MQARTCSPSLRAAARTCTPAASSRTKASSRARPPPAFSPNQGIVEDPATGSAAGACGAYLAANRRLPEKDWFVIEQGAEVHHPSRIEVAGAAKGNRPTSVPAGGQVVEVMRGVLTMG